METGREMEMVDFESGCWRGRGVKLPRAVAERWTWMSRARAANVETLEVDVRLYLGGFGSVLRLTGRRV